MTRFVRLFLTLPLLAFLALEPPGGALASPKVAAAARAQAASVIADGKPAGTCLLVPHGGRLYALTCEHVVRGAARGIHVCIEGDTAYRAVVLKSSAEQDLALLELSGKVEGPRPPAPRLVTKAPPPAALLYHYGAFLGPRVGPTLLAGHFSREVEHEDFGDGLHYYTASLGACYGSSGGPLFVADTGEVLGLVKSGRLDAPFTHIIPAPRLRAWCVFVGHGRLFETKGE